MPELPEVECVARALGAQLPGERIACVELLWPGVAGALDAQALAAGLEGRTIVAVARRAKFLALRLEPRADLVVHLRMTGQMLLVSCPVADDDPYVRARLSFASGKALLLRDVRKFARLYLLDDAGVMLDVLGPEPLSESFTAKTLEEIVSRRRRMLKPLLLDQRAIAGMGNIYADETLWLAGLHPQRRSDTLTGREVRRLHEAVRSVLRRAIANGGTTLRDYRAPDSTPGRHAPALAVYGRAGAPCPRCGTEIVRTIVGGRGTHLCPACQPAQTPILEREDEGTCIACS